MQNPTQEQQSIFAAARSTTANLCIEARAGSGKTSTLVELAHQLSPTSILSLAFNKSIAEEMKERLPSNCESKTLHALGFKVWFGFIRKRSNVFGGKTYQIVKALVEKVEDQEERSELFENLSDILNSVSAAKNQGYVPPKTSPLASSLIDRDDFYLSLPIEHTKEEIELIDEALRLSYARALEGTIDYDDMIYCPAVTKSVAWPTYPITLIDEAQDLSPINHYILGKIVRKNRIIAVGDPFQAIYGFRGALTDSMQQLKKKFDMETLYLTVSFRCAQSVVREAQWRAPDMKFTPSAPEGLVETRPLWSLSDFQDNDAIICRNNAPLFSLAISLITAGRSAEIVGRDLLGPLTKIMKKLGKPKDETVLALAALTDWEEAESRRAREGAVGQIQDRAACLRAVLRQTSTLGEALDFLDALLTRTGRIKLMTGHKSKGLEFDRVWFYLPNLINLEYDQDCNLKYVIQTRAKQTLIYFHKDGMIEES